MKWYFVYHSWSNWNMEFNDNYVEFWGEGETGVPREKTSRSEGENQPQTQPTCGVNTRIWTRATLVGGDCSYHCHTLAPRVVYVHTVEPPLTAAFTQWPPLYNGHPFFWWKFHTLTLVQTSLELSFFPKVAVNWICYPWKCYSHKNAWGHKKRFTLSCSPWAMTWSIRKDKSPQSLKNDAISLWKLGTLSSGQTLTTAKYHNKSYIRWLSGIKTNPYDKKRTKVLQIKKMIDNS